jgi:hypothetical protein
MESPSPVSEMVSALPSLTVTSLFKVPFGKIDPPNPDNHLQKSVQGATIADMTGLVRAGFDQLRVSKPGGGVYIQTRDYAQTTWHFPNACRSAAN